jgi:hypothetical protein
MMIRCARELEHPDDENTPGYPTHSNKAWFWMREDHCSCDNGAEGVAVIRIARQRLRVKHEPFRYPLSVPFPRNHMPKLTKRIVDTIKPNPAGEAFVWDSKLLKKQGITPATIVTDKLRSYGSAPRELGVAWRHDTGRWKNNRAENSHQPLRQRERRSVLVGRPTAIGWLAGKVSSSA